MHWCHLDLLKSGSTMKKLEKKPKIMSQMPLSPTILARRRQPVVSLIALDPLRWGNALGYVPAHWLGQRNGWQVWYFFGFFFHATPLTVRDDTARILARWRRLVALREALKPLYGAILAVSCWRISLSVKTAWMEVHLFFVDDRAIDLNVAN